MEFEEITDILPQLAEKVRNLPEGVNQRILAKFNAELDLLAVEPWMNEDEVAYVSGIRQNLAEGKYDDLVKNALKTTAICTFINNVPFFGSMIATSILSASSGDSAGIAALKTAGTGIAMAPILQATAAAVMLASYPPKSRKEIAISAAIVTPSLAPVFIPGYTTAMNFLGCLTLQNSEEFYSLTLLEGKRLNHYIRNTRLGSALIKVAGKFKEQYQGLIF